MMTVEMNTRFDKEFITQLSKDKNEPEWMLNLRLEAFEMFKELPIPRLEKTKIDNWNIDQFNPMVKEESINDFNNLPSNMKSIVEENIENRNVFIQKNASVIFKQLSEKLAEQGVIFTDLENALQEYPELVEKYFMKSTDFKENKIIALHASLWSGGTFLYVPKNVEVEFPIQALYLSENGGLLPHIIIVAEANSKVTYVDHYFSNDSDSNVHNGVAEVYVGDGATVRYSTIHNFNEDLYDYMYRKAVVDRNGKIEWIIGEMNAGNTVSVNTSVLNAPAAIADSKSIFVGTGNQQGNFVSKVIHVGDHTESNVLSHGVLLDKSTGIFNGITQIEKGAVKSDASQAEKVLMLSKDARGDANPILLIDEYDVIAGHAASAGPVDPSDIYYLMSRGISKEEAEKLIIHGFLAPVVSMIPIDGMQEQLEKVIVKKLQK